MFKTFFLDKKWWWWSLGGTLVILLATWWRVSLDVQINDWFGTFYDTIQSVLQKPNSMSFGDFLKLLLQFALLAAVYVVIAVLLEFFGRHYIFRWREAMTDYYQAHWDKVRHIEGALSMPLPPVQAAFPTRAERQSSLHPNPSPKETPP